ncbi:hypothetical protein pb186bvf_009222 [Paramecium bursaria]
MIDQRMCSQINHQQITHICLYSECNQHRWLCEKCLNEQIHNHGAQINEIVDMKEFNKKIKQKKQQWNHLQNQLGNILAVSLQLSYNLQQLVERVNQIYQQQQSQTWIKSNDIDISKLENQQLQFLITFEVQLNSAKALISEIDKLKVSIRQYEIIRQLLENFNPTQQNVEPESIPIQDISKTIQKLEKLNYHESVLSQGHGITTAQISNNLKYVAGGGKFQLIIWNHSNLEIQHQFQIQNLISILKFTQDSQFLFICSENGFVYQLQCDKQFKRIFEKRIHQDCINQIIINLSIIFTSDKSEIIKTDYLNGETLLIIKIVSVDFDYDVRRNVIVSAQMQSIKFWNGDFGQKLLDEKLKNIRRGILILGNNNQLIVRSDNVISIYYINYGQQKLEYLRKIGNQDIISLTPTLNHHFYLILTNKSILIQSFGDNQIKRIDHYLNFQIKEKYSSFGYIISSKKNLEDIIIYVEQLQNVVQADSMKSILVTDGINLKIYKSN